MGCNLFIVSHQCERERESCAGAKEVHTRAAAATGGGSRAASTKTPSHLIFPPVFINTPPGALLLPVYVFIASTNITSGSLQKIVDVVMS
jgi:hypothetical protein